MNLPFWRRRRREEELEEELESHLRMAIRDRMERGQSAEEAELAARREFGNVGLVKEVTRDMWGWTWFEQFRQDLRCGMRMLLKSPGFTLFSILALALGIGANTVIFSVIDVALLRPIQLPEPDRLARLYQVIEDNWISFSAPDFEDCKNQNRIFESLAAYGVRSANLTGTGEPEHVSFAAVSADFFKALKVEPALGRGFLPEEDKPGGPQVVVLSYGFWRRRFGADPQIVGKTLTLDGNSFTIIGVMQREAQWPNDSQFWRLLNFDYSGMNRGSHFLEVIGRLKPGVSLGQAQEELAGISGKLARQYPETNSRWSMAVEPFIEKISGPIRPMLLVFLGAVGLILLIVCANVAGHLLTRGASREKEVAIRAAVGASRWRLAQQMLTESMLLVIVGGALALPLAIGATKLLVRFNTIISTGIPRAEEVSIDNRAIWFTIAVSLCAGLVFGLFPALQISRPNLNESLKEGGRGAVRFGRYRLRSLLVISELALSLILLVETVLMMGSLGQLAGVDPGFESDGLLTMPLLLNSPRYSRGEQQVAFSARLIRELSASPEVESVGIIANRPLGGVSNCLSFDIEGHPPQQVIGKVLCAEINSATPDYFRTMRIPLLKGRVFTDRDTDQAPAVAVISESMASSYWHGEDPLGQHITISDGGPNPCQIVGIVGDVDQGEMVYRPLMQNPTGNLNLMARSNGDIAKLWAAIEKRIRELDPDIPANSINMMNALIAESVAPRFLSALLLMMFAGLALVLAMDGVYGVMAYAVQQRTHEIGIRRALGARSSDVLRMVAGQGMKLAVVGVMIGTFSALAMTILMKSFSRLFFYITIEAWPIFVMIPLLLLVVALMPCLIMAWRATRIDPLVALRCE